MFTLEKGVSPNVVNVYIDCKKKKEHFFLLSSDRHHDNPHCNQELEKKHLDEALEREAGIIDAGDLFCVMQSKWDPRSNKNDIRPEHQHGNYLDTLVKTAADFYEPYAKNIVALGMGNHECHDDQTEVLTDSGWMLFKDLTGSEMVGTRNLSTDGFEWQKPIAYVNRPYKGDLIVAEGKTYNFAVTPGHTMLYKSKHGVTWKSTDADTYSKMAHRTVHIPVTCENSREDNPDFSDDMLRLVGLILTDGSLTDKPGKTQQVLLFQRDEKADYVRGVLSRLGVTYSESFQEPQAAEDRKSCPSGLVIDGKCRIYRWYIKDPWRSAIVQLMEYRRRIPSWAYLLSSRQVRVMLDAIIFADGTDWDNGFTRNRIHKTKPFLEDLQILLVQNGIRTSLVLTAADTPRACWAVNVCHKKSFTTVQQPTVRTPYDGVVYCCQTPNGTLVTRRGGKVLVSGNCSVLNRHETNLTERLAQSLRDRTGALVPVTGYTGWVRFNLDGGGGRRTSRTLWHMHGYGGGGPVTQDTIQAQRQNAYVDGADIMLSGHVHQRWLQENMKIYLDSFGEVKQRSSWYVKSSSYKEEYSSGAGGWHVGTGKPPKPLGAWWLKLTFDRYTVKNKTHLTTHIEITPTSGT